MSSHCRLPLKSQSSVNMSNGLWTAKSTVRVFWQKVPRRRRWMWESKDYLAHMWLESRFADIVVSKSTSLVILVGIDWCCGRMVYVASRDWCSIQQAGPKSLEASRRREVRNRGYFALKLSCSRDWSLLSLGWYRIRILYRVSSC